LDREASAFFNACAQCDIPALGVVKGVVMVDMQERDALWNTVALSEATQACMQLLKYYYARGHSNDVRVPSSSMQHANVIKIN
jgi:hypothetical protein